MTIAQKAARGALWTVVSSMGGRVIGVLGTLVMTRFMAPEIIGEVSDATIVAMTAGWLSSWGFGQYAVVKGRGPDAAEVTWHATIFNLVLGTIALGLCAMFGGKITPLLDAPHAAAYVPGMALSVWIRRFGMIPERVLTRQMKFRAPGVAMMVGEFAYTLTALGLAVLKVGGTTNPGFAIVVANIVQSTVIVLILLRASGIRSWWQPMAIRRARVREMLKFGIPITIQGLAHSGSRYWDNLAISRCFGTAATGAYNMAYNLADIPAVQVGEQLVLVLMPSMAELPPERRPAAFERSAALLSLIIFPLAVGLGLVAHPLIDLLLPANKWQDVAPLLVVLASLSIFRPVTWVVSAYMEATGKTTRLMWLEVGKTIAIIGGIFALAPFGLKVAASGVGVAFGLMAIGGVILVVREGPSPVKIVMGFVRPLVACGAMAATTIGVGHALVAIGWDHPAVLLLVEIGAGALAYVLTALVVARASAKDLLQLLKGALKRSA
ncbi:MAG: oligosaccharide flippase family protein [Proteobacteria bacterium]|nr:oligosaccharide flippase family protein [Pseudomonadota bacterium]